MIKLRKLLLESDYDAASDFFERRNNSLCYIANSFKHDNGKGRLKWKKIPAQLLASVWLQFGKLNRINDNNLDKISDQMLTNIAMLRATTEILGHTQYSPRDEIEEECDIVFTDEEWEEDMATYLTNVDGTLLLSDYGLPALEKAYIKIFKANTSEEKLYEIDKALNIIHQRNDLASLFVQGGISTLVKIANQGGYTTED